MGTGRPGEQIRFGTVEVEAQGHDIGHAQTDQQGRQTAFGRFQGQGGGDGAATGAPLQRPYGDAAPAHHGGAGAILAQPVALACEAKLAVGVDRAIDAACQLRQIGIAAEYISGGRQFPHRFDHRGRRIIGQDHVEVALVMAQHLRRRHRSCRRPARAPAPPPVSRPAWRVHRRPEVAVAARLKRASARNTVVRGAMCSGEAAIRMEMRSSGGLFRRPSPLPEAEVGVVSLNPQSFMVAPPLGLGAGGIRVDRFRPEET